MELAEDISKIGFRRWYERQLIESHLFLVSCFLCLVMVLACLEGFSFRSPWLEFLLRLAAMIAGGVVCLWAVTGLKKALGYDDSLDVFGVHAIGGIVGAIGTGIVANPKFGGSGVFDYAAGKIADYDMSAQLISQLWGVGTVVIWSGVVSFILFKLIDLIMGLRVSEEAEREGLDIASHGERAYNP